MEKSANSSLNVSEPEIGDRDDDDLGPKVVVDEERIRVSETEVVKKGRKGGNPKPQKGEAFSSEEQEQNQVINDKPKSDDPYKHITRLPRKKRNSQSGWYKQKILGAKIVGQKIVGKVIVVEKIVGEQIVGQNDINKGSHTRPRCAARHMLPDENGVLRYVESVMCHQCQRNDKGRVVRCQKCTTKRYCVPCMKTWYPNMTQEMFAECCPFCLDNCNCKGCLRDVLPKVKSKIAFKPTVDQKVQYSIYTLHILLPFLRRLNEDHIKEKMIESKIQGCTLSDVKLKKVGCSSYERMYCDCCKTSIFDLHRSCPTCSFDLCLQCSWELRDGNLKGYKEEVTYELIDPGVEYLHGGKTGKSKTWYLDDKLLSNVQNNRAAQKENTTLDWKSLEDGQIPCPP